MPDGGKQPETLGSEYGPLQGQTPEAALKQVLSMHSEMAAENTRVRAENDTLRATPAPEPAPSPLPKSPNWDVITGDDRDAATAELDDAVTARTNALVDTRLAENQARSFPADRENAKEAARRKITTMGGDFSEFEAQLDQFMVEGKGMSKEAQIDPNMWLQAYMSVRGAASMAGEPVNPAAKPAAPHVERPSPVAPNVGPGDPTYTMDGEEYVHGEWNRVLGEGKGMSKKEWAMLQDDNFKSIEDYNAWLLAKEKK